MAFTVLALSGGGYLGLHEVVILRELERSLNKPLSDAFDLICGTSVGAMAAVAAAAGIPAARMEVAFREHGPQIFHGHRLRRYPLFHSISNINALFHSRYRSIAIRNTMQDILGSEPRLRDLRTRVIIPAINLERGGLKVFKTSHLTGQTQDSAVSVIDAVVAATAAPIYFPVARLGQNHFVDAGIFANSPDVLALHEVFHFIGLPIADIFVVSIGTSAILNKWDFHGRTARGALFWLNEGRLFNTISAVQRDMSTSVLRNMLGSRYLRIDSVRDSRHERHLKFDHPSPEATNLLTQLAEHTWQEAESRMRPTLQMLREHTVNRDWRNNVN
ncbi:MAG: CBASS cGAMP-activated phospholipase [Gammaproteobacteria bacterium]